MLTAIKEANMAFYQSSSTLRSGRLVYKDYQQVVGKAGFFDTHFLIGVFAEFTGKCFRFSFNANLIKGLAFIVNSSGYRNIKQK